MPLNMEHGKECKLGLWGNYFYKNFHAMLIPTHTVMTFSYLPIHGSGCYALSIKYELSLICPRKSVLSESPTESF